MILTAYRYNSQMKLLILLTCITLCAISDEMYDALVPYHLNAGRSHLSQIYVVPLKLGHQLVLYEIN